LIPIATKDWQGYIDADRTLLELIRECIFDNQLIWISSEKKQGAGFSPARGMRRVGAKVKKLLSFKETILI